MPFSPCEEYTFSQPKPPPHPPPHSLLELRPPLPPHLRRLHIRRALIIRLRKHAHHAQQYLLHALYGAPPLTRFLVVHWVVAGGVEDGDADFAVRIDCIER